MFSTGEIILILGMAGVLIGPKELPGLARGAGRLTGRAAAFLTRSRAAFAKFSDDSEITELHKEMQQSLAQLRQIQYELRSGMNVLEPGPLARKAMALTQQQTVKPGGASADMPRSTASAQASLRPAAAQVVLQEHSEGAVEGTLAPQTDVPIMESIEQEIERLQRLEQRSARLQSSLSDPSSEGRSEAPSQPDTSAASRARHRDAATSTLQTDSSAEQGLGISAVSLGRAPDRSNDPPTGSDIALDALAEQEVAYSVRDLLRQHSKPPDKT